MKQPGKKERKPTYEELAVRVKELERSQQWVKIVPRDEGTLPISVGWYIVAHTVFEDEESGHEVEAFYWNGQIWHDAEGDPPDSIGLKITHWRPLPPAPKKEEL